MEDKLNQSDQSSYITESLESQIFGLFAKNYKKWNEKSLGSDFVKYFDESQILSGQSQAILRALLYFNLPEHLLWKKIVPRLGFTFDYASEDKKLQELILKQEEERTLHEQHEEYKGSDSKQNKANIILMEVLPEGRSSGQ